MNPADDQLSRLLRAAAKAPGADAPQDMPFGFETRVMAAWRESRTRPAGLWDTAVLLRGLIVAGLIMAASFLPAYNSLKSSTSTTSDPYADFLSLTDTTVSSDQSQ